MRKILLVILMILMILAGYVVIAKGISFLGIASIEQINKKNQDLDKKLQEVSTLTSTDYPKAITNLNDSSKQLIIEKENYADLVSFSTEDDIVSSSYIEKHNLEHLWVKIGNYATKNGITLKMEITTSSTGAQGEYNLNFTANGKYVSISEFIAALEDDSTLEFKIEEFKLVPTANTDGENLQATFTVKDIAINIEKNKTETETNKNTTTEGQSEDTNTTTEQETTDATKKQ